ncbi:MAG: oligosaccharide flippase family protein [Kofleriaceae bacterium]
MIDRGTDEPARLRRDVAWNIVPVFLLAGVGLGLNFLIGGWWGESALGSFSLVTHALFSFAVVGACGLQFSVLRAIAEDPDDRDRVAAIVVGALVPTVVIAGTVTVLFVVTRHPIGRLLDSSAVPNGMLWATPGLFCFSINKLLFGVVNGLRRMRAFAIYTSLRYLLIAVGLVMARVWHLDAEQLPVIWSFVEGVLLLVLIGELATQVSLTRRRGWFAWAKQHVDFGARGVLSSLAFELNSKLDVWMLGVAMSESAVGIYSMASALYEGAMQLAVVLQNNLNPVMARAISEHREAEVSQLAKRTRRWFVPVFVFMCALSAALYPVVVPWLIGKESFIAGAVPFAIMMAGLAVASPYLPFIQILLMAARPGWHTVYVVAVMLVNFAGNYVLIPVLGTTGAAIGTATAMVTSAVLVRVLVRWRVGLKL